VSNQEDAKPLLASLVQAGNQQTETEPITDFIFMAKDISNAYLVTTNSGDVMVNTGFMDNAERTKRLLEPRRSGPLHYIILTQAHADHYGGVPVLRESVTKVVAERRFVDTWRYFHDLGPYLLRRSAKLWSGTVKRGANPPPPPEVIPDIVVDRRYEFELGGRQFQVISTPGGEALDSLTVWLPKERVAFTGNLFGPVFLAIPNLVTMRGDKPRLVQRYLPSLDTVRKLGAELLITGHGDPIRGADKIRAALNKMYSAVSYVNDAVIAGMNAGQDVHTLMREIRLPDDLKIGEFHGKVSWAVRSIWEEYSGWFHYDSTTSLYGVPRSSIDADLVELAGGVAPFAARAQQKLREGRPLEAIHLLDIALATDRSHADALAVKKEALQVLQRESGGTNLSEVMWLKSELAAVEAALKPAAS
jgi:glyoxylase-like metal-dependent hydrolase (beta-lactamase superfamily II)